MAQPLTTIGTKPLPEETHSCWSCGAMRAAHFCESCGKVQPPAPVDYFAFFGLPRKLHLDVAALEKDFYELNRKLHPDVNARASSQEQEWSLEQSSLLNDAYRTLRDPIKRTQYLLRLEGVELEDAVALARLRVEADVVAQPRTSAALHTQAQSALLGRDAFLGHRAANLGDGLFGHHDAFGGRGLCRVFDCGCHMELRAMSCER